MSERLALERLAKRVEDFRPIIERHAKYPGCDCAVCVAAALLSEVRASRAAPGERGRPDDLRVLLRFCEAAGDVLSRVLNGATMDDALRNAAVSMSQHATSHAERLRRVLAAEGMTDTPGTFCGDTYGALCCEKRAGHAGQHFAWENGNTHRWGPAAPPTTPAPCPWYTDGQHRNCHQAPSPGPGDSGATNSSNEER